MERLGIVGGDPQLMQRARAAVDKARGLLREMESHAAEVKKSEEQLTLALAQRQQPGASWTAAEFRRHAAKAAELRDALRDLLEVKPQEQQQSHGEHAHPGTLEEVAQRIADMRPGNKTPNG